MMTTLRSLRLATKLADFGNDIGGNIAVIFAIALLPILTALGCAVDYSLANAAYAKLQSCADGATVAAVSTEGVTQTVSEAQVAMANWFNATCPASASILSKVTIGDVAVAVTAASDGVRTAKLSFKASRANDFLQVAGLPHTDIKGSATASSAKQTYIDMYALLDDSPSMGLGATSADQTKLMSLTGGCQFGCHVTGSNAALPDNYTIARQNSIQMRIDVLRDSWINLLKKASGAPASEILRFATYTFDSSLNLEQPLTSSIATARASANNIDLMSVPSSGPASSYADNAVQAMTANIPAGGDGSSADKSKKYLIFVTDGVQDLVNSVAIDGHQTEVLTSSACAALKAKGVNLAVIYTVYLPMNNVPYNVLVQPLANNIAPALQACASSGLFFPATNASDIADAFDAIFARAAGAPHLTN
jgi:Flp pilus assembly protein TadG